MVSDINIDLVFENRVLRRIFGQKRDEVTGVWRKLHNGMNGLVKKDEVGRACSTNGGRRGMRIR